MAHPSEQASTHSPERRAHRSGRPAGPAERPRIRRLLHHLRRVHVPTVVFNRLAVLYSRHVRERLILYVAAGGSTPPDPDVRPLEPADVLDLLARETWLRDRHRTAVLERLRRGVTPYGLRDDGQVVHVSWLGPGPPDLVPEWLPNPTGQVWAIRHALTARSHRGRGLYTRMLRALTARVPPGDLVLIYTNLWNHASRRGILKAGFRPTALLTTRVRSGQRTFEAISEEPDDAGTLHRVRALLRSLP